MVKNNIYTVGDRGGGGIPPSSSYIDKICISKNYSSIIYLLLKKKFVTSKELRVEAKISDITYIKNLIKDKIIEEKEFPIEEKEIILKLKPFIPKYVLNGNCALKLTQQARIIFQEPKNYELLTRFAKIDLVDEYLHSYNRKVLKIKEDDIKAKDREIRLFEQRYNIAKRKTPQLKTAEDYHIIREYEAGRREWQN